MGQKPRIGLVVLTAFSFLFLFIGFSFIWNGWFFPKPLYTAGSLSDVWIKEITFSSINLLLNIIILFVPIYIISLFFKSSQQVFSLKRFSIIFISVLLISVFLAARPIYESLQLWQPLEESTKSMSYKTFTRGNDMFLRGKSYSINFTHKGSNLSFIQSDIVPSLQSSGYSVKDFGFTIGGKQYTTSTNVRSGVIHIDNFNQLPFATQLSTLDEGVIIFHTNKGYGLLKLVIFGYQGNEQVRGILQADY